MGLYLYKCIESVWLLVTSCAAIIVVVAVVVLFLVWSIVVYLATIVH